MLLEEARAYIKSLYETLLHRQPSPTEFEHWVRSAQKADSDRSTYFSFISSEEYKSKTRVSSLFPAGHYYSAVVDPATVGRYVERERLTQSNEIAGIVLPMREMEEFWQRSWNLITRTPFPALQTENYRFFFENPVFSYGDAITLRAMMADLKPRAVIEIGSGFSSVCMLDCADEFRLDTKFTFIDPNPERLKSLLRSADYQRVTLLEIPVQQTDTTIYRSLGPGDILFIDSTHVLKTGSDVHFELFHILPALHQGVVIHFHDIHFPFEYPDPWIFHNNHSWNEIYALRAFLSFNSAFRIRFWGDCFARERRELVHRAFPAFLKNPGGSLWIEKTLADDPNAAQT
jgi:predicted O-methyltransferase YrrM